MKKLSLLLLILFFALAASGGYGYFLLQNDSEEDDEPVSSSGKYPKAKITPSNPKIQVNENISFSASESTDPDGDDLTFVWSFEGDSKEYEGETIVRNFPDKGEYRVVLKVTDSTDLSAEAETVVLVVEDYHDEHLNIDVGGGGNDDSYEIDIPVESGFLTLEIEYILENDNVNPLEDSQVTLRLTDADGVVVDEENGVGEGDGTWSYSTDDLSSTGTYVFTIESESGTMECDIIIDVTY